MPAYLGQLGALGRVHPGSRVTGHDVARAMVLRWSPGGQPSGRSSAHRAPREWQVSIPLTHGESVAAYHQAVMGGYGTPCLWLPADAVGGNLLTPEQYAGVRDRDQMMWSNAVRDLSPALMPGGRAVAGSVLRVNTSLSRSLLDAHGAWAFIPAVPGQRIHISALLSDPQAAITGLFRTLADTHVASFSQTNPGADATLRRVTASAVTPATAAFVKVRVDGGGRIAEPVVTMGEHPPIRGLEGRGCAGVHIEHAKGIPSTVSRSGVRSTYDVLIREAVRI